MYAEPIGYWKNNYNVFDFTVLVFTVIQSILTALNFGQMGLTVLKVIRGTVIATFIIFDFNLNIYSFEITANTSIHFIQPWFASLGNSTNSHL